MTHDTVHHFVYACEGDQHADVWRALRVAGVELVEAGPASTYARDIQTRQRWNDAAQFERIKTEISRLRCAIVDAIHEGSTASLSEALKIAPRFDWDWNARNPHPTEQETA